MGAQETVEPPVGVSASQYGFSQAVRISWVASPSSSVNIYRVYRSTTGGSLGEPLGAVSGLAFVDTGISYNITYYYRVVATYAGLDSAPSAQVSAVAVVPAPRNVWAQDTQEGRRVTVTWERPDPGLVLTFDVYRSTSALSAGSRIASRVSGTEYTDTSPNNGTTYYYRVRSVNSGNVQSSDSGVAAASPTVLSAEKPRLSAGTDRAGSVSLSWTKPADAGVSAYRVYRSLSETELGDFRIETTSASFTERDLPRGTTYYYRVQALGALRTVLSESEPARVVTSAAVGPSVLLPVANLAATASGSSGQIRITWENPPFSNFSYARIYRNTAPALGSLVADRVSGASYLDQGLEDGITYYYAVKTVDANNNEHPDAALASASPFARARGSVPPPPVTSLSAVDRGDGTSIKLSWKNPAPHWYASISIYRSTEPSVRGGLLFSGYRGSEFLNTRSVQTDQRYYYTVLTMDANGVQSERNPQVGGVATRTAPGDGFDTDADGLPDAWERGHGFHPRLFDLASSDDDHDGLGVLSEYQNNTDPWNPDSDGDGHNDGTEVQNSYDPLGPGRKVIGIADAQDPGQSFAYGKTRLSSVAEEALLASMLRRALEAEFGAGRIPNPRSHWPALVNAYIYGGYTASEIGHTLRFGPGLVHPAIAAPAWRQSGEYRRRKG
ncbi:MAG: hypothetical protein HY473_02550 [Candidatus Sungbacteria bacterium]|uniref:Fibronectin type-III domain-containing protein n=1 Tax=Candidatus Sungiibacteriota bacterium TaxID=2750080 RepID=A0A933DS25_9BACT|nr:hypothetical protein [Candidatus Sungbacteria bacterium]